MKKFLILLITLMVITPSLMAQPDTVWTRTYGYAESDGAASICKAHDGGYVFLGYTNSYGDGNLNMYLVKTDSDGNQIWNRLFGGPNFEYGYSVIASSDGGYVLTGYTASEGAGSKDVYLVKTDSLGNIIWEHTYGGEGLDVGKSVCQTDDGHYLIAGYTESFGAGDDDIYLIKVDSEGQEIWSNTYGNTATELGWSVIQSRDGNYIVGGSTGSLTANRDVYLLKTDTDGNTMWTNSFHLNNYDAGNSLCENENGELYIVGDADIHQSDVMQVYVIKADSMGNQIWEHHYGESSYYDYGNSVCLTDDGDIIVCGITKSVANGNDVYLIKIDPEATLFGGI